MTKPRSNAPPPARPAGSRNTASAEQAAEDANLMQQVAEGHQEAIKAFYDRFAPLVYRIASQSIGRADADDAVQEIFVRLWRTAERYDPDRAALVTWVMLITRRHVVDRLRRAKARIQTVTAEPNASWDQTASQNPGQTLEADEDFRRLLRRVDTLPELQRLVVMRAYLGGQTLRQISEEIDTPIGTVKSALSRALVRLRERTGAE